MEEQFKDIEQLIKEAGTDQPSSGFLKNIMSQIELSETQKSQVYQPLISKKTWLIMILTLVLSMCGILLLSDPKDSILNAIDYSFLNDIFIKNPFSGYTLHKTAIYGILFLSALFFIQIPILKRRIDRSFSI